MKEENINIHLLGLASICSAKNNDVRFYLKGVCIKPIDTGGVAIIATDGHRCVFYFDPEGFVEDEIIISTLEEDGIDFFRQARKAPKVFDREPLVLTRETATGVLETYNDTTGQRFTLMAIDGNFPDTNGLFNGLNHLVPEMSNKDFTGSFSISSTYLKDLKGLIPKSKTMPKKLDGFTVVCGPTPEKAITFYNVDYKFIVMIMPLKAEKEKISQLPDWAVDMLGYGLEEVEDDYLSNYNNADEIEPYGVNPLHYEK